MIDKRYKKDVLSSLPRLDIRSLTHLLINTYEEDSLYPMYTVIFYDTGKKENIKLIYARSFDLTTDCQHTPFQSITSYPSLPKKKLRNSPTSDLPLESSVHTAREKLPACRLLPRSLSLFPGRCAALGNPPKSLARIAALLPAANYAAEESTKKTAC